jgi:hypothetical protein
MELLLGGGIISVVFFCLLGIYLIISFLVPIIVLQILRALEKIQKQNGHVIELLDYLAKDVEYRSGIEADQETHVPQQALPSEIPEFPPRKIR